jgi:hypothetical protein
VRVLVELIDGPGDGECVEVLMAAPMPMPETIEFRETLNDLPSVYRFSHQREDGVMIYRCENSKPLPDEASKEH